jgi:hypothetical protein
VAKPKPKPTFIQHKPQSTVKAAVAAAKRHVNKANKTK